MDAGDISTQEPDPTFRQAATYAITVIVIAALFLGVGGLLYDPVPLAIIIVPAPGPRRRGRRALVDLPHLAGQGPLGIWQGASWFLLALFLISLGGTGSALLDR